MRCTRAVVVLGALLGPLAACSSSGTKRVVGQSELFRVDPQTYRLEATLPGPDSPRGEMKLQRPLIDARFGDPIRYNDDVVALQVQSIYLEHLPATLLNSRDVIVFAEVWENGAEGYNASPINSVVHLARNQMVPGRLNFEGNMAYGPTVFKGHPVKIRFTVMVLQKEQGKQAASAADVLGNVTTAATMATPYSVVASSIIGIVREILRSQPDVIAMDYEFTWPSHAPEGLLATVLSGAGGTGPSASVADTAVASGSTLAVANRVLPATDSTLEAAKSADERLRVAMATCSQAFTDVQVDTQSIQPSLTSISLDPKVKVHWGHTPSQIAEDVQTIQAKSSSPAALDKVFTELWSSMASAKTATSTLAAKVATVRPEFTLTDLETKWPWLRYGMYAIVETQERTRHFDQDGSAAQFRLYLDQPLLFDRGWLFQCDGVSSRNCKQPLETNYIVFSLTPHQLAENDETLAAASQGSLKLLTELRQTKADLDASAQAITDSANAMVRQIAEARAESLARRAVKLVQDPSGKVDQAKFEQKFDELLGAAFKGLDAGHAGYADPTKYSDWKDSLKAMIKSKWAERIKEHQAQ